MSTDGINLHIQINLRANLDRHRIIAIGIYLLNSVGAVVDTRAQIEAIGFYLSSFAHRVVVATNWLSEEQQTGR